MRPNADTGLFIPRPEYQVFPMELPPLSRKNREQAALNRLRGIFPGKLEDKHIVLLPNGKRGAFLALVFEDELRDDPLSIPTLAAAKLCKKGRRNCVIAWGNWVEYIVLENGKVLSSMVAALESSLLEQVSVQAAEWLGLAPNPDMETAEHETIEDKPAPASAMPASIIIEVFCSHSNVPAETPVRSGDFVFHFTVLEKALLPLPRSAWTCFPGRLPQVKRRRRLFAAAACAAAIVLVFFAHSWYKHREAVNAARREAERLIAMEEAERKTREEKLAALKAAWEKQLSEQHIGVYRTIETLASCLSPAIRLSSAAIKEDGSFILEGTAADAIAALANLQGHPEIRNAVIGTIVWDGRLERFTVNGAVEQRPLAPEGSLDETGMIAWYEAALTRSVKNGTMPETAAMAAERVRDLLERRRISITRFRYLESITSADGWTIECSVSGTGMQVVQLIKEADTDDVLTVTALETRNRQNGLDAVLTFFVRGPGEENRLRDYEEHPSLARIASLYGALPGRPAPTPEQTQQVTTTGLSITPPAVSATPALLEYVGYIGIVGGRRYIYAKDTKTDELYRLAEGDGSYSYSINSAGLIIAILDGASSPVEVRRNDGF